MPSVEELFCSVDDFCQVFEQRWQSQLLSHELQVRKRNRSLCLSEVMTILIGFHQSYYRNFKSYYLEKVQTQWQSHFPQLVSYHRFIEWVPDTLYQFFKCRLQIVPPISILVRQSNQSLLRSSSPIER
jgi:hypothetical protein